MVDSRSDSWEGKDHVNLLVRGTVKAHEEDGCATAVEQDMELTGACLGNTTIFVRTGLLETSTPFAVSMNGSSFEEINNPSGTDFLSIAGFSVPGETPHEEPEWCFQTPEMSSTWIMRKCE